MDELGSYFLLLDSLARAPCLLAHLDPACPSTLPSRRDIKLENIFIDDGGRVKLVSTAFGGMASQA